MSKKIISLIIAGLMTVVSVTPVMAGPAEEVAAARAESEKRLNDYYSYQVKLAEFQAGEIAKGEAQKAAGKKAEADNFARIKAFQQSEIAKGEAQKAAGKKAEAENFAKVKAFQDSQLAKQAEREKAAQEAQKYINKYLGLL